MSNRHFWPTEPGEYLVEHRDGEVKRIECDGDNWSPYGDWGHRNTMIDTGWLGVRKPLSEEAERVEFEAEYKRMFPQLHQPKFSGGMYGDYDHRLAFKIWLAAKRHERGIK